MKRGVKLLILAGILAILGGAYMLVSELTAEEEAQATEISIPVLSIESENVVSISLSGSVFEGELTSGTQWALKGDETFPVDQERVSQMLGALTSVTTSRVLNDTADLAEYGLEEPSQTIKVLMADGSSALLRFGSRNKLTEEYYLRVGDGAQVYLVESALHDAFDVTQQSLLKYEEIPRVGQVSSCTFQNADRSVKLVYFEDNAGRSYSPYYKWFLLEGSSYTELDTEAGTAYADLAAGVTWISCADWNTEENELEVFGLDEPAVVVLEGAEGTLALEIGAAAQDGYYARLSGSKMVYIISAETAQTLIKADTDAMLPTDVCLMDWDTVQELDFKIDGETHKLKFIRETNTDSQGEQTNTISYSLDGTQIESESVLAVTNAINAMESSGTTNAGPAGEADLELLFIRSEETFAEVTLSFSPYDVSDAAVTFNGVSRLLVTKESVTALRDLLEALAG